MRFGSIVFLFVLIIGGCKKETCSEQVFGAPNPITAEAVCKQSSHKTSFQLLNPDSLNNCRMKAGSEQYEIIWKIPTQPLSEPLRLWSTNLRVLNLGTNKTEHCEVVYIKQTGKGE